MMTDTGRHCWSGGFGGSSRSGLGEVTGRNGSVDGGPYDVKSLLKDAPADSIRQRIGVEREEETVEGPLSEAAEAQLNTDVVSEKVDLDLLDGEVCVTVCVRCERTVPLVSRNMTYRKSSVIVTRTVRIDMTCTESRRELYESLQRHQNNSSDDGKRLGTKETFQLYKGFMGLVEASEAERKKSEIIRRPAIPSSSILNEPPLTTNGWSSSSSVRGKQLDPTPVYRSPLEEFRTPGSGQSSAPMFTKELKTQSEVTSSYQSRLTSREPDVISNRGLADEVPTWQSGHERLTNGTRSTFDGPEVASQRPYGLASTPDGLTSNYSSRLTSQVSDRFLSGGKSSAYASPEVVEQRPYRVGLVASTPDGLTPNYSSRLTSQASDRFLSDAKSSSYASPEVVEQRPYRVGLMASTPDGLTSNYSRQTTTSTSSTTPGSSYDAELRARYLQKRLASRGQASEQMTSSTTSAAPLSDEVTSRFGRISVIEKQQLSSELIKPEVTSITAHGGYAGTETKNDVTETGDVTPVVRPTVGIMSRAERMKMYGVTTSEQKPPVRATSPPDVVASTAPSGDLAPEVQSSTDLPSEDSFVRRSSSAGVFDAQREVISADRCSAMVTSPSTPSFTAFGNDDVAETTTGQTAVDHLEPMPTSVVEAAQPLSTTTSNADTPQSSPQSSTGSESAVCAQTPPSARKASKPTAASNTKTPVSSAASTADGARPSSGRRPSTTSLGSGSGSSSLFRPTAASMARRGSLTGTTPLVTTTTTTTTGTSRTPGYAAPTASAASKKASSTSANASPMSTSGAAKTPSTTALRGAALSVARSRAATSSAQQGTASGRTTPTMRRDPSQSRASITDGSPATGRQSRPPATPTTGSRPPSATGSAPARPMARPTAPRSGSVRSRTNSTSSSNGQK